MRQIPIQRTVTHYDRFDLTFEEYTSGIPNEHIDAFRMARAATPTITSDEFMEREGIESLNAWRKE